MYPVATYLRKVLANRYYVAEDYAKAFLMMNSVFNVAEYFPTSFVDDLIALEQKKDKTRSGQYIFGCDNNHTDICHDTCRVFLL